MKSEVSPHPQRVGHFRRCKRDLTLVAVADPLGAYAGASVGQSTVKADPLELSKHDWGWKILAGIRPLALLGAEIAYTDFGHPNYSQGVLAGLNASVRASSAEALGSFIFPFLCRS